MNSDTDSIQKPDLFLNLNVSGLGQSATLAVNERSRNLEKKGRKIYKWGLGQSPFPVPESVVQSLKKNAHQKDYLPVMGLPELRSEIAGYYSRKGIVRTGNEVMIGPGSKELLFLLQLVYYGELVIPAPSWVSYEPQARMIGRPVRWLKTKKENNWLLTAEELERCCREKSEKPRVLILNYPSNPAGITYSRNSLAEIADVARKYRMILLSDEIYGELNHNNDHLSMASFYPEGTIISSGLSKWCGAGGWRLGTFTFPDSLRKLQDAMGVAASETFTSTSAPIQYAAVTAFRGNREIDRYLANCRKILKVLGTHLAEELTGADLTVPFPSGGFYLLPGFENLRNRLTRRGIFTDIQLCEAILKETGIATLPGSCFGLHPEELTLRIAYVNFNGGSALKAVESKYKYRVLDASFLDKCCRDVTDAQKKLCEWIAGL